MFRKPISLDAYTKAETICDPLNLFDIAPAADGAAALLLVSSDILPKAFKQSRVRLSASAIASDSLALHSRPDPLVFSAARESSSAALKKAGLSLEQIDLFEYCDAFSIHAALSLEAAGFAERGKGWELAADGSISLAGRIPCATLGGCKARGNPLGASGVYQAVEAVLQLRGQAGKSQVKDARTAMIQCLAGPASAAATHILERMD